MSIGSRLAQLRKANNLSGDRFGELCGVSKGAVSQWESDLVTPPTDRLLKLHEHLDFSFDWLLNGKEDGETAYTTSDPTLIEILKVLEPRADYFKETALKTVLSTIDLVDHVQTQEKSGQTAAAKPDHEQQAPPDVVKVTVNVAERRRAMANKHKPSISVADRRKKDAS